MNVLYKHDVGMNKDKSGYNLDFTVDDFTKELYFFTSIYVACGVVTWFRP